MIERICRKSGKKFVIAKEDLEFYAKMGLITEENLQDLISRKMNDCSGLPTLCPEERQRRRMCWRNERKLYQRKCDSCEKSIVSVYQKSASFPVYCQRCWWEYSWEALDYGRDFNFQRPFFDQFQELSGKVPCVGIMNDDGVRSENSEYCFNFSYGKNCYLVTTSWHAEDCLYVNNGQHLRDVVDSCNIGNSELSYECINGQKVYNSVYLEDCFSCSDCYFSVDLKSCRHCFGCIGLRNAQYCIFNKSYSEKDYIRLTSELNLGSRKRLNQIKEQARREIAKFPRRDVLQVKSEDCVGDALFNCKQVQGNVIFNGEYCKYYDGGSDTPKNSYDILVGGAHQWGCESIVPDHTYMVFGTMYCWKSNNVFYSDNCHSCSDCFGCVGLKHKQYCILNKQYTKEAYEELLPKIISHMKQTGEWGEFFPAELSPFAYNETVAQEYYPLTKKEAEKRGYKWKDEPINKKYETLKQSFDWSQIPDDIQEVGDDILTKVLFCECSGKPYQIQKAELKFYRKMNLPIPHLHPDERHKDRMKLRNPRKLYERTCADCQKAIQTTFAPDRPEKILCEECYLKVVD
ncbi:hypothetical protein CSB37_03280 [bacterium DOLZORAL124_38_8]|nr:MAG: hypothetical protein CSB37_03280 [bacterium DOLZORAL124_38_8]